VKQIIPTGIQLPRISCFSRQFGRRAFSHCGLDVWNSLAPSVRIKEPVSKALIL